MPILTDLLDADTRRRILEDNEDLVAPLSGIVVDEHFQQRGTFQPEPQPVAPPAPQPVVGTWDPTLQDMPKPQGPYPGQRDYTPPAPQPPEETPRTGFLGGWSTETIKQQTGAEFVPPGDPIPDLSYDVGDIQGYGEPPPSQFPPHPMEGLDDPSQVFESGSLDMKQQLLEDIRDWEDIVYGGQRQDPLTGLRNEYLQDPRFVVTDLTATEIEDIERELAAWEDDFGAYVPEDEGDLYLLETLDLIGVPEGDEGLGLTDYPEGYGGYRYPSYGGGYGVPSGYSPYTPNRRQGYVGLVSWRI